MGSACSQARTSGDSRRSSTSVRRGSLAPSSGSRIRVTNVWGQFRVKGEDALSSSVLTLADTLVECHSVFDGHGGPLAAAYCAEHMVDRIVSAFEKTTGTVEERMTLACRAAFEQLDTELAELGHGQGTTATVVLLSEEHVVVANVGDSAAYLFPADHAEPAQKVTAEHRAAHCSEEERKRCEAHGATFARATATDGKTPIGPLRLFPGGLMVTRSLGDSDSSAAVIPTPDVCVLPYPEAGAQLLLASDGLWDFVDLGAVSRWVALSRKPTTGVSWFMKVLMQGIREKNAEDDDASAIFLKLSKRRAEAPRRASLRRGSSNVLVASTGSAKAAPPRQKSRVGSIIAALAGGDKAADEPHDAAAVASDHPAAAQGDSKAAGAASAEEPLPDEVQDIRGGEFGDTPSGGGLDTPQSGGAPGSGSFVMRARVSRTSTERDSVLKKRSLVSSELVTSGGIRRDRMETTKTSSTGPGGAKPAPEHKSVVPPVPGAAVAPATSASSGIAASRPAAVAEADQVQELQDLESE